MTVRIERAGFLTTVQDLGRIGHRASGVSVGGALDQHALRVANLLVGNDDGAAGLEATLGTLRLRFEDDRLIAWCGGPFEAHVGDMDAPAGHTVSLRSGDEFQLIAPANGGRAWVAISGGLDVPRILGSRATDLRSGFGGVDGRALRDGDVLKLGLVLRTSARLSHRSVSSWSAPNEWSQTRARHPFLRVLRGNHWPDFDAAALAAATFTATADSDRMGLRLAGPELLRRKTHDLISEPVGPGTIQVPPSGQPIILLGNCQTIGGYPKLAHVITVDLSAAAQLRPGDPVRFVEVTLAEAQRLLVEREREVKQFRIGLELQVWN